MKTWSTGETFEYDAAGMVREATLDGGKKLYLYSASDERIATVSLTNGTETSSSWTIRDPSGKVLRRLEKSGAGSSGTWTWKQDYIYRGTQLLAAETDGPDHTLRFHPDHLGTPRLITGSGGAKIALHTYYPFGEEATAPVQANVNERLKFTGHERDRPSLDYMHARYYNPQWGRFLSVDPALDTNKSVREPQRWNRYSYVTNNPTLYSDPDGRDKRIMVLSVIEPDRMALDSILNGNTSFGVASAHSVEAQHSLGWKALKFALGTVDHSGTDIPVILSHGGYPLQTEMGGGADGRSRMSFDAGSIASAIGDGKAQAIVLAGCSTMKSAQGVANLTNTIVFGTTATASSRELGRSGAVLASVYAQTGNAAFAVAVANRMLTRRACAAVSCEDRPQWNYVQPQK